MMAKKIESKSMKVFSMSVTHINKNLQTKNQNRNMNVNVNSGIGGNPPLKTNKPIERFEPE